MKNVFSPSVLDRSSPNTATLEVIRVAYLILVHRLPNQFKRLFNAIYSVDNHYLIHIDKKASIVLNEEIRSFLLPFPNVHIMESENVLWGGYSMVQAELNGIKYFLESNSKWDYFINLSGQDYPLKSQKIIREFLSENKGTSFLKFANQRLFRPETMNRIENRFHELENSISTVTRKRDYMKNVIPYIGGQWMMLTRACCQFICNSSEVKRFEHFYRNTLIADESFFQTVLMNTSFSGALIDDDKRAIIWVPDGNIKLRPKTFTGDDYHFLTSGNNLFARKFDDNVDSAIIDRINLHFNVALSKREKVVYTGRFM